MLDTIATGETVGEDAAMRAKLERRAKSAVHVVETFGDALGHFAEQKIMLLEARSGTVPMLANGAAIENGRRHLRHYGMPSCGQTVFFRGPSIDSERKLRLARGMDVGRPALRWVHRAFGAALDAVLPPQCLSCSGVTQTPRALCAACWANIVWLGAPLCACCGVPFEFDAAPGSSDGVLCAPCLSQRPAFVRARAVFQYNEASRGLVLAFKHADRTHGAPAFGQWLARAGAELLADADIVAPVPLHWTRLAWRRYNQAALLAHAVAQSSGRDCIPDLLKRTRRTPTQGERGRAARRRNVRRAFAVLERHRPHLFGRRVVLVDDVFTTGATVEECARVLTENGAASVAVLTLARVVRPFAS